MYQLYEAKDRIEAQLLKDFLLDNGIEAEILGDYLDGAAGELSAMQFPALWLVNERDQLRGQRLLKQFKESQTEESSADWRCPVCGELSEGQFSACWQCGSGQPEIEL